MATHPVFLLGTAESHPDNVRPRGHDVFPYWIWKRRHSGFEWGHPASYNIGAREAISNRYKQPLLYGFGATDEVVSRDAVNRTAE